MDVYSCLLVALGVFLLIRALVRSPLARDAVIEGISDALIVLDAQNRIVDLNAAAHQMVGCTACEAIGKPAAQVFSAWPDLAERFCDELEAQAEIVLRHPQRDVSHRHASKDKGEGKGVYDLRVSPLGDGRGRLSRRLIVLRDVTERVRAEEALRERENRLEATLESTADGILVVDNEGRVAHTNARFAEMWRLPEDLVQSRDDEKLLNYVLDQLAEELKTANYYVLIRGNASRQGLLEENKKLAAKRAETAASYLISRGISQTRVRAIGVDPSGQTSVTFMLGQMPY